MDVLLQNCDMYIGAYASLQTGSGSGKTKLDKYRLKTCKTHVVSSNTTLLVFTEPLTYLLICLLTR